MEAVATWDRSDFCMNLWRKRTEYRKTTPVSEPPQNKILVAVCVIINQPFFCGQHDRWRIYLAMQMCEARVYGDAKRGMG